MAGALTCATKVMVSDNLLTEVQYEDHKDPFPAEDRIGKSLGLQLGIILGFMD
jgi:hypothetical protein